MTPPNPGDWAAQVVAMLLERPCGQALRDLGARIEAGVDKPVGYDPYTQAPLVLVTGRGGSTNSTGAVFIRSLYVRSFAGDEERSALLSDLVEKALDGSSYKKIRSIVLSVAGQESREPDTGFPFSFSTYKLVTTK